MMAAPNAHASNIVLIGASGAGKSSTGWLLARLLGYGFIDVDHEIERQAGMPVHQIFADQGEASFRASERRYLEKLQGLRMHVVALGGGAVVEDENWELASQLGLTVWLNTPAEEIARRLTADGKELDKRPLLSDVQQEADADARHRLLSERVKALIGNRVERYRQAAVTISDSFSTPESTAHLLKDLLVREGHIKLTFDIRPFDRWDIM